MLAPVSLAGMASAMRATQDATTGLWFQVVDKGALSNSPHGLCAILLAASEMESATDRRRRGCYLKPSSSMSNTSKPLGGPPGPDGPSPYAIEPGIQKRVLSPTTMS